MKKTTKIICITLIAGIVSIGCTPALTNQTAIHPEHTEPRYAEILTSTSTPAGFNTKKGSRQLKSKSSAQAYKRMLVYHSKLYVDTGETSSMPRCGVMDEQIKKTVAPDKTPTKELQSNFGKYGFQYGRRENRIEVCIDNTWHIFAYNENNLDGVTMDVVKNNARSAKLMITNSTDREIIFGDDYELERLNKKTKEWQDVDYLIDNAAFHSVAYEPKKDEPTVWKVNWKIFHGKLKPGTYRIVKKFLDFKETGRYTEYTLMTQFKVPADICTLPTADSQQNSL